MTASLGDRKRERIDALAARAGALPEGDGGVSLVKSAYRRLRRDPVAILGAVIVLVFLLVAAFAPLLAPRDPLAQTLLGEIRQGFILILAVVYVLVNMLVDISYGLLDPRVRVR